MSIMAPNGRQPLSADALFCLVRRGFEHIPDHRCGDVDVSLPDALMSAFAMCSLTSPSLLACDKERAEGHVGTIYGTQHVPCATSLRARRDPVSPESLRPVFKRVFGQLQRGNAREELACLDGHSVWCLHGTGSLSSQTMHCASCVPKVHRHGSLTDDHPMLGAAMVHPDVREVMPLRPDAMLLACLVDQTQPLCGALFRAVWATRGRTRLVWERMRALFSDDRLASMREWLEALLYGVETSHPVMRIDTSSSLEVFSRCGSANLGDGQSSRTWSVRIAQNADAHGDLMSVWLSIQLACDQHG